MNKSLSLSLHISADGRSAAQAGGEVARGLGQIGPAAQSAAAQATAALGRIDAAAASASRSMAGIGMAGTPAALAALRQVAGGADQAGAAMAGAERTTTRAAGGMGLSLRGLAGAFGILEAARVGLKLAQTTREMQDLDVRLQGVTKRTGDYAGAEAYLIKLSTDHHKALSDVSDGYIKLLALEGSGIVTRREAQQITAGLSDAQSEFGASSAQLGQVMFGLSQGLASAILHMEELNQVTEPLPGLLARIDRAAGLPAGGFRALVAEGKVTSAMFKDVLIKALGESEGAAARSAGTITAASNDIRREWELLAKAADKPITFVANIAGSAAGGILREIRAQIEQEGQAWNNLRASMSRGDASGLNAEQAGRQLVQVQKELQSASGIQAQNLRFQQQQLIDRIRELSRTAAEASAKAASEAAAKAGSDVAGLINSAAAKFSLPPDLVRAVGIVESGLQQSAKSSKGAIGVMQLMPKTAAGLGVDPSNLQQNIEGGARLLRQLFDKYNGDITRTLAAYNWGQGNLDKFGLSKLPEETKKYLGKVQDQLKATDLAAKFIDLDEYKRNLSDAEALFTAQLGRQVSAAEAAARREAAARELAQTQLDAEMASRRNARSAGLIATPAADRPRMQGALDQAAAADATEYARRRAAIDQAEITAQERVAQAKLQALQAERARAAEFERSGADQIALDGKIAESQAELAALAERRRAVEVRAGADIATALQKEAEARDSARRAAVSLQEAAISRQQQYASAVAQGIQAQQNAGLISQSEARSRLAALYRDSAGAIRANVEELESLAQASNDPAIIIAAERAKAAWLDMATSVRSPMEALAAQWADTTAQMEQATVQWTESLVDRLTDALVTGRASFSDFARSVAADFVRIQLRGMVSSAIGGGSSAPIGSAVAAAPAAVGSIGGGSSLNGAGSIASSIGGAGSLLFGAQPIANVLTASGTAIPMMGSGSVGGWITGQALKLGVSPGTSALLGSGVSAASGWGVLGGLLAGAMGLGGQNQWANMALSTVGSIAGGIGGTALGATYGVAAGGPIGAIVGAILGTMMGSLFKVAQPAAGAEFTFGRDNSLSQTYSRKHAGGQLESLQEIGRNLGNSFRGVEKSLDIELGRFYIALQQKGGKFRLQGVDASGSFFEEWTKFKDEQMQDVVDRFGAAVLKRRKVVAQIDDVLQRGAVQVSDRLSEVPGNWQRANKIREYESERTGLADDLSAINQRYRTYRASVIQFAGSKSEPAELAKLDAAYQARFNDRIIAYRDALAKFGGRTESTAAYALQQIEEQYRAIAAQNRELAAAAKKSGGALSYSPATDAELAAAKQGAIDALKRGVIEQLRELSGQPTQTLGEQLGQLSRTFEQLRADAAVYGLSLDQVAAAQARATEKLRRSLVQPTIDAIKESAQSALDAIAGPAATIDRISQDIGARTAMLSAYIDQAEQQAKIQQIIGLVDKRYQLELSQVQNLIAAGQQLKETVAGLRISDLSPYPQAQQTETAAARFRVDMATARAGGADAAAAAQRVGSSGTAYLQEASQMWARGSEQYRAIFDEVTGGLDALGQAISDGGQEAIKKLQERSTDALEKIQLLLEQQAQVVPPKPATASDIGSQVANALSPTLGALNVTLSGINTAMNKSPAIPQLIKAFSG